MTDEGDSDYGLIVMISRDNKKLMESCRWIFGKNDLHLGPKGGDRRKKSVDPDKERTSQSSGFANEEAPS